MSSNWFEKHREELHPQIAPSGATAEPLNKYYARISTLLPNFPYEVIEQWFHRHPQVIEKFSWLDYRNFTFTKELWTADKIINSGLLQNKSVVEFKLVFEDESAVNHKTILEAYSKLTSLFKQHGTWPKAPIFIENMHDNLYFPMGYKCTSPYYLMEGHKRCAVLLSWADKPYMKDSHHVWVIKTETVNNPTENNQ